ncbi:MAG TPA: TauD/TfdA family dioxygenase [Gammaproteobacteria bacterium]|nr:TauD/TfdA family dioxygenase [Gammaproteobacteria bacterium]|tara:strand:- start:3504 stop:4355 length:852 start_codon:yes stop_codon:yes gene_type:complete
MSGQLTLREIKPNFVAEVVGLKANNTLSVQQIKAIKVAWSKYPILIFPDQVFEPTALISFSKQLGELGLDPFVRPLSQHKHVIEVRREARESTPIFGASWHSDWSFQPRPPSGTLLHAKTVPPVGGDTLFGDCHQAFEMLPAKLKTTLTGLSAIHSAAPAYGPRGLFSEDDASRSMKIVISEDAEKTEIHPLVRTHPLSGRKSLFINDVYTLAIVEMEPTKGRALLKYLLQHMTEDAFVHRHKWHPDMLVLWDNRCVVHYADGGYEGHQRIMHRTTLAGERPA